MSFLLQKIGTVLIVVAIVLLLLSQASWSVISSYVVLTAVLIIDLWLVYKKEKTITQWYRAKLPRLVDTILTIALVVVFAVVINPVVGLYFLLGTINGHLNGDW